MSSKTVKRSYWNQTLLDFLINQLSTTQLPFVSKNSTSDNISEYQESVIESPSIHGGSHDLPAPQILSQNQIFSTDRIPQHFIERLAKGDKVTKETLDNLYIFKVNTKDSLLHSLLGLLDSNYQVASWERKEYLVGLFRSKLYYDIVNDQALLNKLKQAKISISNIQKGLAQGDKYSQEKFPTELLKKFISVYFNINLIIVTNDGIEYIPTGKDFDHLRPALLFYQYPFGNLSPIIQGNVGEQAIVWSKSSILQTLIPLEKGTGEEKMGMIEAKTPSVKSNDVKKVIQLIKKPQSDSTKKDGFVELTKEIVQNPTVQKDIKKEKELMRLSLPELQSLCETYNISTNKPGIKLGTWKNRTKKELAELLMDKYTL